MSVHAILGFWLLAAALIAVPGPDWAFTLGVALRSRYVASAVGGLATGYVGLTLVVATGVGAFAADRSAALTVLTAVGGGYLIALGLRTLRRASGAHVAAGDAPETRLATYLRGVSVSGLNPKGLLVFLAVLPQFADRSAGWPLGLQLAVLGGVFTGSCTAFYLCLGSAAGAVLNPRPRIARAIARLAGIAMAAIGVALVIARARA